jgi:hypothetical protein
MRGAHAYVLKPDPCRDVLSAVEALIYNRSFFTSSAAQVVIDELCKRVP